jgi:hypothetical protein
LREVEEVEGVEELSCLPKAVEVEVVEDLNLPANIGLVNRGRRDFYSVLGVWVFNFSRSMVNPCCIANSISA